MTTVENAEAHRDERTHLACAHCSLHPLCMPSGLEDGELSRLDALLDRRGSLRSGEHLYQQGDVFRSVYVVRSGSIKTYIANPDGVEQITGFNLPGEVVGLEGASSGRHSSSTQALEATRLCRFPYEPLERLAAKIPSLGQRLLRILSREILNDHRLIAVLGKPSAQQRVAALLVSFGVRLRSRGLSDREFSLSMSRHDIGSYLGLAGETVMRVLARFRHENLIRIERRRIVILDLPNLKMLAGVDSPS